VGVSRLHSEFDPGVFLRWCVRCYRRRRVPSALSVVAGFYRVYFIDQGVPHAPAGSPPARALDHAIDERGGADASQRRGARMDQALRISRHPG
jgi:hypothetical protein